VTYGKFIGILVFMMTGGLLTGTVYPAEIKIASVDMQRAVNECNAGKEAKKGLTQETEKFQRLIAEKQKELRDMEESLAKQSLMLNPDARAAREKEFQAKVRDFQRWGEDVQNEVNQKRIEIERNISIGLMKVVQEIGANEGYALILQQNESIVLFASMATDITDQVVKAFNVQKK